MKNKIFAILGIFVLAGLAFTGCGKKGCTDSEALNYDADAKRDDESCIYETEKPQIVITDDGSGTGTTTWTADNEYLLDGFVFVNSGQTLTIEPGTVIKGAAGTGADASALVVARGGTIMAVGTETNPIIFTAELDDVTDPNDIPMNELGRGLWGGLIVLGDASLNSTPGETAVEGIPTTETRGMYGGSNDTDNSGKIKYVSIRHGGTDIGAGNEINGLTLGGVGSGTEIDYVEVIANADDGVEFFGGTASCKHMIVAFCGDDSYDYDEGFRGKGQFWVTVQASDSDRGGEHDGGTDPETGTPYAMPTVYNATYIGGGDAAGKRTITFRDNAGGHYNNSIFVEFGKGIDIELLASGESSYSRFAADELTLNGNVFYNVADNDANAVFSVSVGSGVDPTDSTNASNAIIASFAGNGNVVEDPSLSISYTNDGNLNLNPGNSNVLNGATPATDSWFDQVTYKGAFDGTNNWAKTWTALSAYGYMAE